MLGELVCTSCSYARIIELSVNIFHSYVETWLGSSCQAYPPDAPVIRASRPWISFCDILKDKLKCIPFKEVAR